jgi:uncharacterized protein (DUF2384 family)
MGGQKNMKPISARQRRRLVAALTAKIRHYERCLKLLPRVDAEVLEIGFELFSNELGLALWLCEPARALGGKIPLRVMRTARGRKEVVNILGAIAHGTYL